MPLLKTIERRKKLKDIRKNILWKLVLGLSSFALFDVHSGYADTVASPIITHQAFITVDRNVPIKPLAVVKTFDNGFIIAGRAGFTAWAAKIDGSGNALWNYFGEPPTGESGLESEFRGAVPISDGSTYLCGYMPHPPNSKGVSTLLTHLDAQGHVLSSSGIVADGVKDTGDNGGSFDDCARWGNGIAIVGHAGSVTRSPGALPVVHTWYQLVALDSTGNIKWENDIPLAGLMSTFEVGPLIVLANADLVFAATDNNSTELIVVSSTGALQARKRLAGRFILVRPVASDDHVQIIGRFGADKETITTVTYGDTLEEIDQSHRRSADYFARVAYRLPDHSLVVFGSRSQVLGGGYASQIVYLTSGLFTEQRIDPPGNRSPFLDSGSIWAAGADGSAFSFITARSLSLMDGSSNNLLRGMPPQFKSGAVLDFVQLK